MKKVTALLLFTTLMTTVLAHEYVLLAYDFFVEKGQKLELHLFVADGFNIEMERPYQESMTRRFELISENGTKDLKSVSKEGALPVLDVEVDFEGLGLIHLERDFAYIKLPNEQFQDYLKGDNIENVTIDKSKPEQSERYSRYIKSLVQSNPKPGDQLYKTEVGHNFEIVLLENPYQLDLGDWISAKVLFMGKPLTDKAITARNRQGNEAATYYYSRTDKEGIVSFKLERGGEWFMHSTHMIPSPDSAGTDWDSFWTSYSFGIKESD